ncbi:MAG: gamma-glutamyl-phosphate reductase, partial [Acidobacteriaceae bacterium]
MTTSAQTAAESAKLASHSLASAAPETLNQALLAIAAAIEGDSARILEANQADVAGALTMASQGELSQATVDRLRLSPAKLKEMAASVRAIAALPGVIGKILDQVELDTGLELEKISCPLGVLAVIFEARPDAVTQISALAIKSGNAA